MSELLTRMFFGGFVRLHVLYHAIREPIFGVEMMEDAKAKIRELVKEVLHDDPPTPSIRSKSKRSGPGPGGVEEGHP